MKYNKFIYILIFVLAVVVLVIKVFFIPAKIKSVVETDKIVFSTSTVRIPIKIFATKDTISHVSFYIVEKNVQQKVYNDFVIALKKGQDYSLTCEFNNNLVEKKDSFLFLTKLNILHPIKRKYLYYTVVKKPVLKVEKVVSEPVYIATTVVSVPEVPKPVKEEKIQSEVKEEKKEEKIVVKEKPDFEIVISSEGIKKKYGYDEKIKLVFVVKNKSVSIPVSPKINIVLKTKSDIVVSSQTITINLTPAEIKTISAEFDVLKDYLVGNYYIELNSVLGNTKYVVQSEEFEIVDIPPRIGLPEMPTIRYKLTNTILAEVEDDREVVEVKLIEVIPRKKQRNEYQIVTENQMVLIAGNKKAGLYSFTTTKILKKDFYTFYIQAKDSSENVTKTEVFKIKITK
jgi:hypothetical protein